MFSRLPPDVGKSDRFAEIVCDLGKGVGIPQHICYNSLREEWASNRYRRDSLRHARRCVGLLSRPKEPSYRGKPLHFWLQTYAPSSSSGRGSPARSEADDAVRHIGTNCFAALLRMLRGTESRLELRQCQRHRESNETAIATVAPTIVARAAVLSKCRCRKRSRKSIK